MIDHAYVATHARTPGSRHVAAPDGTSTDEYTCPLCGLPGLARIPRRFIDHILGLFVRQRRFRCTQPGCQWQGNLRRRHTHRQSGTGN